MCGKVFCDTCSPKRLDIIDYAFEHASEEQLPLLDALRVADDEPRSKNLVPAVFLSFGVGTALPVPNLAPGPKSDHWAINFEL